MNVTDKGFLHVYTCECCGRAIYKGDMYLEEDNGLLCERCAEENFWDKLQIADKLLEDEEGNWMI